MVEGEKEPYSFENMILPASNSLAIRNIQNNFDFEKSFFSSTGSPYNHATFHFAFGREVEAPPTGIQIQRRKVLLQYSILPIIILYVCASRYCSLVRSQFQLQLKSNTTHTSQKG